MATVTTGAEAVAIVMYLVASVTITLSPFVVSDVMLGAMDTIMGA